MEHYQVTPLNEMNAKCNHTNRGQKEMALGCHKVGIWGITPIRERNAACCLDCSWGTMLEGALSAKREGVEVTPWVYTWCCPLLGMNWKCAISNALEKNVLVALEMKVRWGVAVHYPPVRAHPRAHLYSLLPSDFTS